MLVRIDEGTWVDPEEVTCVVEEDGVVQVHIFNDDAPIYVDGGVEKSDCVAAIINKGRELAALYRK